MDTGEGEEGEVSLSELYERGFAFISTAKQMRKGGDLHGSYAHYLQGIEVFFSVAKKESDAKKTAMVKRELSNWLAESEALKRLIDGHVQPHSVPVTATSATPTTGYGISTPATATPLTQSSTSSFGVYPSGAVPGYSGVPPRTTAAVPSVGVSPLLGTGLPSIGAMGHSSVSSSSSGVLPVVGSFGSGFHKSAFAASAGPPSSDSSTGQIDSEADTDSLLALLEADLPAPPVKSAVASKAGSSAASKRKPSPSRSSGPSSSPSGGSGGGSVFGKGHPELKKAESLLDKAIATDKKLDREQALLEYLEAAQSFMKVLKSPLLHGKAHEPIKQDIRKKLNVVLGRIEVLKKHKTDSSVAATSLVNAGISGETLSTRELGVLRKASTVRHMTLYPWTRVDEVRQSEGDMGGSDDDGWKDPHGLLGLSEEQKKHSPKWRRITNISQSPKKCRIVNEKSAVTPYCIKQTLVGDCSFVSSMTVAALYELRFKEPLITSLIFPQDQRGRPVVSKNGKYSVKLFLNGCFRKIEIDDYLPVSSMGSGKMLCSFSQDSNEFWVSLLEKAFLKVMGGYDFPGSNSAEDLHCLTGWVPERVRLTDLPVTEVPRLWERLVSGMKYGDCLITTNSKEMDEKECEQMGLVKTHAYAVLRVEKVTPEDLGLVRGAGSSSSSSADKLFLLLKNPWSHKRWLGKYSVEDSDSWSNAGLRKRLGFDPSKDAVKKDTGVFWIEFTELCSFFTSMYLSWRPQLFGFKISQHWLWSADSEGPKNDTYNLGYNPQFLLDVDLSGAAAAKKKKRMMGDDDDASDEFDGDVHVGNVKGYVWVLLSKHMENTKREEQSKDDFLTLHVFNRESRVSKIDRRVFTRRGCFMNGTYINSAHYLVRLDVDKSKMAARQALSSRSSASSSSMKKMEDQYTIVVSQFEKQRDVSFTLTCYATLPCRFRPINDAKIWRFKRKVLGRWTDKFSGGSRNNESFPMNPQFRIMVSHSAVNLRLMLEAPKEFNINVQLFKCVNYLDKEEYEMEQRLIESKKRVAARKEAEQEKERLKKEEERRKQEEMEEQKRRKKEKKKKGKKKSEEDGTGGDDAADDQDDDADDNPSKTTGDESKKSEETGDGEEKTDDHRGDADETEDIGTEEENTETTTVTADDMEAAALRTPETMPGKIVSREHFHDGLLVASGGSYGQAVSVLDAPRLKDGVYIAIVSTFEPRKVGGFRLTMRCSHQVGFQPV